MQSWLYLAAAIVMELGGTTCMKLSDGLTRPAPAIAMFGFYGLSFAALTMALKKIDLGVAYAIWSGVGTALIALIGVAFFREPLTALKVLSIALIIFGVVGLNLSFNGH